MSPGKLYRQKVPVLTTVRTGWLSIRLSVSYPLVNNWRFQMEAPDSNVILSSGLKRREALSQSNTWVRGGKSSPESRCPWLYCPSWQQVCERNLQGKTFPKVPFLYVKPLHFGNRDKGLCTPSCFSVPFSWAKPPLSQFLRWALMLHVAAALSPSSKAHWLRSGLWKTTRIMTACNYTNGQTTSGF